MSLLNGYKEHLKFVDEKTAIIGLHDGQILVFEVNSLEITHILSSPDDCSKGQRKAGVKGIGISKDGNFIGVGNAKSTTAIYSVQDNFAFVKKINGTHNQVWSLAFNQENRLLAIGYRNNVIQIYDLKNDTSIIEHTCHADCYELTFISNSFLIAQLDSKVYRNVCFYKIKNI